MKSQKKSSVNVHIFSGFLDSKKNKEFRVFGVLIQSHNTETLKKFSDEIVEVAELLDAEAEPLLEI